MPKRHRIRARARRPLETAVRTDRADRERTERTPRRHRTGPIVPGVRATGEASAVLERAATLERQYVLKDGRRLLAVIAVMLVLLAVAGVGASTLLR